MTGPELAIQRLRTSSRLAPVLRDRPWAPPAGVGEAACAAGTRWDRHGGLEKGGKIILFLRQGLSHAERYFAEKFEEHDLSKRGAYTCDDAPMAARYATIDIGRSTARPGR